MFSFALNLQVQLQLWYFGKCQSDTLSIRYLQTC